MKYYMTAGAKSGVTIESFEDIEDAVEQIHQFWENDSEDGTQADKTIYSIHEIDYETDELIGMHRFNEWGTMYFVNRQSINIEPKVEYIDEGEED